MLVWRDFVTAVALLLVVEGIMPFLKPDYWRQFIGLISQQSDTILRLMGLGSMIIGTIILHFVRSRFI